MRDSEYSDFPRNAHVRTRPGWEEFLRTPACGARQVFSGLVSQNIITLRRISPPSMAWNASFTSPRPIRWVTISSSFSLPCK